MATGRITDINKALKWNASSFFTGSLGTKKGPSVLGEDHHRQFCEPGDNPPIEERCAVNLIISQRPVIFPRAGIFSLLKNTNHCYHSSNLSNQSGVWNIKLEYIIPKGILLAKSTLNWRCFSQPFSNKRVTACSSWHWQFPFHTLSILLPNQRKWGARPWVCGILEKNTQQPWKWGKYSLLRRTPKRKKWLPLFALLCRLQFPGQEHHKGKRWSGTYLRCYQMS